MQNYLRQYGYVQEYWKTLYDTYSKHGVAFPVTYYQLDIPNTVWDSDFLMGGAYEKIGPLSGLRWKKILMFPLYDLTSDPASEWSAEDLGYTRTAMIDFYIPSSYGIIPSINDMIKFEQKYLTIRLDSGPLFSITGMQQQSPANRTYFKCHGEVEQSRTVAQLELQLTDTLMFFDYDKKIHSLNNVTCLTRILSKNETVRANLKNLYDDNSGYYFI